MFCVSTQYNYYTVRTVSLQVEFTDCARDGGRRKQNAETGKKPQSGMIPVFCGFFCYGYDAMVIIEIPADERPWIAGVHPVRKN